jgi:hypothetical protein
MKKRQKVWLSERAVMKRINRWLATEGEFIYKVQRPFGKRSEREKTLGRFFIVRDGKIVRTHIDLVGYARKAGVLRSFEAVMR